MANVSSCTDITSLNGTSASTDCPAAQSRPVATSPPPPTSAAPVDKMASITPTVPTRSATGFFNALGHSMVAPNETAGFEATGLYGETAGDRAADVSGAILHTIFSLPEIVGKTAGALTVAPFKACFDAAANPANSTVSRVFAGIGAVLTSPLALLGAILNFFASIVMRNTLSRAGEGLDSLIHLGASPIGKATHDFGQVIETSARATSRAEMKPYIDLN